MSQAFIEGSSLPFALITLFYVGSAFNRAGSPKNVPIVLVMVGILLCYGLANALLQELVKSTNNSSLVPYLLVGAGLGLMLSIIGRRMDLPRKLFGFSRENENSVHLIASVLYAFIFATWIRFLNMRS